jgi:hypothetical protein
MQLLFAATLLTLSPVALSAETFSANVWAENRFEMRINGETAAEDSVPITTERSFNAECSDFVAERPFIVGLVAKDFMENDTGLEYIGTRRRQMDDGGIIGGSGMPLVRPSVLVVQVGNVWSSTPRRWTNPVNARRTRSLEPHMRIT